MSAAIADHSTHKDLPSKEQGSPTELGSTERDKVPLRKENIFPTTRLNITQQAGLAGPKKVTKESPIP